ncbi:MAG: hypothetical protein F4Y80_02710 [Caldilineaceae bacterium SB0665_bin_21]|nr:hypothetical protein [Caldilineaceae bacterium SB0665_bin_21]
MWQRLLPRIGCEPWLQLVDSFPLPVCQFARAYRGRCFGGEAAFGYDGLLRQTFYGFRVHVLVAWPGVIVRFSLAPADVHETAVVPELVDGRQGIVVGDRNDWSPLLRETLAPHAAAGPLQASPAGPLAPTQCPPQPRPVPDRYGLRSTRGPLPHQARPDERPVASGPSSAPKSAQPHPRVSAEPGSGPPSPTTLEVGHLI